MSNDELYLEDRFIQGDLPNIVYALEEIGREVSLRTVDITSLKSWRSLFRVGNWLLIESPRSYIETSPPRDSVVYVPMMYDVGSSMVHMLDRYDIEHYYQKQAAAYQKEYAASQEKIETADK
jgi:hypothetical protein